jgi:hypothetical protein
MARKEVPHPQLPPASTALSPDKEIELLVKSIEESSKHCRETLIALLVASFYILITVISYSVTDKVKLPLVGLDVPDSLFLILGPFLVLAPFIYLQICVSDLKGRLAAYEICAFDTVFTPHKNLLLFPSVVTMGLLTVFPHANNARLGMEDSPRRFSAFVRVFTVFLIYGFVPVVLLSLWGRFINHQQFESIFPAAAIIIAVQTIAPEYKRSTVMRIVAGLFSATIVAVSFASVPKFRNSHILAYTWVYAVKAGHLLGTPAGGVAVSLAVCAATMYLSRPPMRTIVARA